MKGIIRAVIVEDELIAAEFLKEMLQKHGVEVLEIVDSGREAIEVCRELKPDAVFMDVMLRDNVSGSEAAVEISRMIETKIIFLTAYVDEEMVDYAVQAQAAGYLTKPYNEAQIIATLRLATEGRSGESKATSTEAQKPKSDEVALLGGYIFSRSRQRLSKAGREIPLGPKARKLVGLLCEEPGVSVSNEQICMHVWGEPVNDKTLRSLIFRIRHLTDEALIRNVSGAGYLIEPEIVASGSSPE